jgi:hypothetical protein
VVSGEWSADASGGGAGVGLTEGGTEGGGGVMMIFPNGKVCGGKFSTCRWRREHLQNEAVGKQQACRVLCMVPAAVEKSEVRSQTTPDLPVCGRCSRQPGKSATTSITFRPADAAPGSPCRCLQSPPMRSPAITPRQRLSRAGPFAHRHGWKRVSYWYGDCLTLTARPGWY